MGDFEVVYPQWKLRKDLAVKLQGHLSDWRGRVKDGEGRSFDVWVLCSVHYVFTFLGRCAVLQKETLSGEELTIYRSLVADYESPGPNSLLGQFQDVQRRLLSVFREVKAQFEEGSLPLETLSLLTPNDKPASIEGRSDRLKDLLSRLSVVLALDGFLDDSVSSSDRESLRRVLDSQLSDLRRYFYQEGDAWSHAERRETIARLLWAQIVRDERKFEQNPSLLDSWWLLLQEFERLEILNAADVELIEFEANSLSNIMRFAHELEVLAHVAPHGWGNGQGEGRYDKSSIEELKSYTREILVDRLPAFCQKFSEWLAASGGTGENNTLALYQIALALRVVLQYYNLVISPGVRTLGAIDKALRKTRVLEFADDGSYYPTSFPWRRYAQKCKNVADRLARYVETCVSSKHPDELKPFVILVVGEPGTGKSQFVKSVVKACLGPTVEIIADLSQATSLGSQLEGIWKKLIDVRNLQKLQRNNKELSVPLLQLEEFDSQVGARIEQYRRVLRPLWDSQIIDPLEFNSIPLGPFVAVCIMSKISTLASARRILAESDKGLDFLSRVDVVVEVPFFDRTESQVELVLVSLGKRSLGSGAKAGEMKVSQVALWFLGWIQTGDNFRSISKALKTVREDLEFISYQSLNLDPRLCLDFEMLLMEFWRLDRIGLDKFLSGQEEEFALGIKINKSRINLICPRFLSEAFQI